MPKLILKPVNQVFEVSSKESIFEQLKEVNINLNSSCGGFGVCGDCVVKVIKGGDQCSPPTYKEIKLLGNVFHLTNERLSCQLKINADCEIDIANHLNNKVVKSVKKVSSLKTKRRKSSSNAASKDNNKTLNTEDNANEKTQVKEAGFNRPKRKF